MGAEKRARLSYRFGIRPQQPPPPRCTRSGARVCPMVQLHQALAFDRGVALRGRQAGVPEQLLDRPAGRRRRPADGSRSCGAARAAWRSRAGRRAGAAAASGGAPPRTAGACRARRGTAARRRRRAAGRHRDSRRAPRAIAGRIGTRRCLPPLPVTVSAPQRGGHGADRAPLEAERLADAQAGAVQQQEQREVALAHPRRRRPQRPRLVEQRRAMCGADSGRGRRCSQARRAQRLQRRVVAAVLPVEKAIEAAHRGERARGRASAPGRAGDAPASQARKSAALEREQRGEIGRLAEMLGAEAGGRRTGRSDTP